MRHFNQTVAQMGSGGGIVNRWRAICRVVLAALVVLAAAGGAMAQTGEKAVPEPNGAEPIRIVAFGDSLTAGYGVKPDEAFPVVLQRALRERGRNVVVANAGVSGDTTSAGRDRLAWAVSDDADAVIVELGANDALRGLPPERAKANLEAILGELTARGLPVLLAGMKAPRNLGADYTSAFDGIYPALADKYGTLLYPFFLDGVATDANLNQADAIHPNAKGVAVIVERILPTVEALVDKVKAKRAAN